MTLDLIDGCPRLSWTPFCLRELIDLANVSPYLFHVLLDDYDAKPKLIMKWIKFFILCATLILSMFIHCLLWTPLLLCILLDLVDVPNQPQIVLLSIPLRSPKQRICHKSPHWIRIWISRNQLLGYWYKKWSLNSKKVFFSLEIISLEISL